MERLLSDSWIQIAVTAGHGTNGTDQVIHPNIFENIPVRSILNGAHNGGVFRVTREHKDPELGCHGYELSARFGHGGIRQFHVQ
jgi:hypothetical protein